MSNTEQTGSGSINIGRDNNGTAEVHNHYGPVPLSFTEDQLRGIYESARSFKGELVNLAWEFSDHTNYVADTLARALIAAGLCVNTSPAVMTLLPDMTRPERGLRFASRRDGVPMLRAIAQSLQQSNFLRPGEQIKILSMDKVEQFKIPTIYIGQYR